LTSNKSFIRYSLFWRDNVSTLCDVLERVGFSFPSSPFSSSSTSSLSSASTHSSRSFASHSNHTIGAEIQKLSKQSNKAAMPTNVSTVSEHTTTAHHHHNHTGITDNVLAPKIQILERALTLIIYTLKISFGKVSREIIVAKITRWITLQLSF
jgi:hypothetical protein